MNILSQTKVYGDINKNLIKKESEEKGMRMKRFARVFTSAMLAGAMMMTMGGMTAFAEPGNDEIIETPNETPSELTGLTKIPLTKKVTTDGNTYAPNTTFTFTLDEVASVKGEIELDNVGGKGTYKQYAGIEGGLYFGTKESKTYSAEITFTPSLQAKTDSNKVAYFDGATNIQIDQEVFNPNEGSVLPGIYRYSIQEADGKYDGIDYDTEMYYLLAYVQYDETTKQNVVTNVLWVDKDGNKKSGGSENPGGGVEITNNYGAGDTEEDDGKIHDLTVTKVVTGNQGDRTKEFSFDVTITGDQTGVNTTTKEQYKVVKINSDGTETPEAVDHLTSGEKKTYKLSDGQSIRIYGLSENDVYAISEQEANADGYTTTFEVSEGVDDTTKKVNADASTITVTNNKNVSTPTGIVLSFAPYILLVALAGVFAVLFLRRKKEEF